MFSTQANPLNHKQPDIHLMTGSRGMLAAKEPLVVPMLLRLSHFKLNSYVVLVVSKQKGITLVFKTDPLQNVDINSTFDSIAVIQKFIQREIEGQLRQMFREDLPGIIHRLSQQWVKAKVEAPYLDKRSPLARRPFDVASTPDLSHLPAGLAGAGIGLQQPFLHPSSLGSLSYGRARSISGGSVASRKTSKSTKSTPPAPTSPPSTEATSSIPELENFDPTYGLRPEGLPTKSVFSSFGRLFKQNKGLADLTEESSEVDEDEEQGSFSVVDWDDSVPDYSPPASVSQEEEESVTEYETIPAIGGGTITRPRVYHSLSMIQPPSEIFRHPSEAASMSSHPSVLRHHISQSQQAGPSRINSFPYASSRIPLSHRPTSSYNPYFPDTLVYSQSERQRPRSEPAFDITQSPSRPGPRPITPDSLETQFSRSSSGGLAHSIETPSTTEPPRSAHGLDGPAKPLPLSYRRLSVSSSNLDTFRSGSPPTHHAMSEADPKIVLHASLNNTIHQLSTLSHSNHTLSPYTRSLEHFTVRSVPPRTFNAPGMHPPPERRPVKAKRKRTYRLGGTSKPAEPARPQPPTSPPSPVPPSEFDQSDIDQYFRSRDDSSVVDQQHSNSPPHSPLVRARESYDAVCRRRAY
jgi:distribution and morphology protein 34